MSAKDAALATFPGYWVPCMTGAAHAEAVRIESKIYRRQCLRIHWQALPRAVIACVVYIQRGCVSRHTCTHNVEFMSSAITS